MTPGDLPLDKDAVLHALVARVDALTAQVEGLKAENTRLRAENAALRQANAKLREKLDLPPKTPDNSSTPPSKGQKASEVEIRKPKATPHAGTHRPLHPNPTHSPEARATHCPHSRTDLTAASQVTPDPS